ncbi:T7SS effector LXG polymorphic toxin [Virgibacillus proomii]|uniref:T7SS effector LXG polymorphic toxin n=1 Tax=Virgibacillus proomii TaxID=84407 RepID=UPI0015C2D7B3|nr:T7SS effector LXG polymorphic toxin [Virgibacillus proomii]
MSIKALYVRECYRLIDKTLAQLEQIHTQIKNIQKSIEGIIALEDAFKGKTANSIRTFYKEVHQPFLLFLEGFIDHYSNTLREIKQSIDELEPDRNGVIREDFLAGGVQRGLKRAEHMAMMLTDEANAVLRSVRDIIDVRDLDDGEFLDKVQHAKKMTHQTIEKLYLFDRHHTAKLEPVEQDLHTMKNYVSQIRKLGNSGQINIATYQARKIADQKIHQKLMQGLMKKAGKNAIDLEVIMGELGKRLFSKFIPLAAIPINYMQKHFGLKTMDYSYRAIHANLAATGDSLTASEFSTIEHLIVSKVKVSDYKGVRQGVYYTLADGRKVRKFKSETGINFKLVRTIPANRHKPKEPEKSWLEKATDGIVKAGLHVGLAGYKTGKAGLKASKEALDFVVLDDVKTVMDPKASTMDRVIAGASIIPHGKVLKLVKAGGVIKFADKGKQTVKKVKGTENRVPSYGKKSVPVGPYREVNGFPVKVKSGAQEKHIPNTPNYKQELANGKNKSILYGDNKTAQELLDKFAGKGTSINKNKERVEFDQVIGKYYDMDTGKYTNTTRGMIHYSKSGAHIVPSEPLRK